MIVDFRFSIFDWRLGRLGTAFPTRFGESNPGVGRRVPNRKSKIQNPKSRRGITLTEILIAIMILGIGLVSLATLFPIGLIRLRDAARYTRSTYLTESAAADAAARGLFSSQSFLAVDSTNGFFGANLWYANNNELPLTQDTPSYGALWENGGAPPILGANSIYSGGYGLPFAYDPLWRYQTINPLNAQANGPAPQPPGGYYLNDANGALEARFGSGIGFIRDDPTAKTSGSVLPSAHGLQRLTNFTSPAIMPQAHAVPNIFVSPEDVVWQEGAITNYTVNGAVNGVPVGAASPVVPDLSLTSSRGGVGNDWHYSWMFTGYQVAGSGGSQFEGNIVIFENRPFGIDVPAVVPNPPAAPFQAYVVEGETVVEAIFGHSANINAAGYAAGADRTVLLRWYSSQVDPVVRVGDWIADVTYERQQQVVYNTTTNTGRFLTGGPPAIGVGNPFHSGEWDNMPAQRCIWYQVQKVSQAIDDPYTAALNLVPPLRSMVVYVDRSLQSRTVLTTAGNPAVFNAALISPYVVNVIPQQITVRATFTDSFLGQ